VLLAWIDVTEISDFITQLIQAGADPITAAKVVSEVFAFGVLSAPQRDVTRDARDDRKREFARIRQRRRRDRVTRDERDEHVKSNNNNSLSDDYVTRDVISSLSKEERDIAKVSKRESRAQQLSRDWRPDDDSWMQSIAILGTKDRCEYELKKFHDHALEKGRTAKNWNAAWRNWAKRAVEYGGKNGHAGLKNADNPRSGSLIGAIDRRLAEIEGEPDSTLPEDYLLGLSVGPVQRS